MAVNVWCLDPETFSTEILLTSRTNLHERLTFRQNKTVKCSEKPVLCVCVSWRNWMHIQWIAVNEYIVTMNSIKNWFWLHKNLKNYNFKVESFQERPVIPELCCYNPDGTLPYKEQVEKGISSPNLATLLHCMGKLRWWVSREKRRKMGKMREKRNI